MKRLQRSASMLLLSLSLSVMFLNLSSVKAYAIEGFYNAVPFHSPVALWVDGKEKQSFKSVNSYNVYQFSNSGFTANENIHFTFESSWELVRDPEHFDYYLYIEVDSQGDFNFNIQDVQLSYYVNGTGRIYSSIGDFDLTPNNGRIEEVNFYGYRIFAPFPSDFLSSISSVRLLGSGSVSKNVGFSFFVIQVPKGSDESVANNIVDAINNQTHEIKDKIDEVLTPEGENNLGDAVDQITDQVQENFGALGFAHDTVENFIGLFNEEPPAPIINVPPLKMKIKGVEHQFFNGYQYDFRSMEDNGLSVLVGAVRTAGTLVLWWAFLQYCLKEFEGFFRR